MSSTVFSPVALDKQTTQVWTNHKPVFNSVLHLFDTNKEKPGTAMRAIKMYTCGKWTGSPLLSRDENNVAQYGNLSLFAPIMN